MPYYLSKYLYSKEFNKGTLYAFTYFMLTSKDIIIKWLL